MAAMESPEDALIRRDLAAQFLGVVTGRDREIIIARFGLNGDSGATLLELGREYRLSAESIRRIEGQFLRRARRAAKRPEKTLSEMAAEIERDNRARERSAKARAFALLVESAERAKWAAANQTREAQLIENSKKEIDCIRRGLPPDAWKNWN